MATVAMTGCGKKVSGKYADDTGMMTVEFKGGKAYLSDPGSPKPIETSYTEDGDKVTIVNPDKSDKTPMVFTRGSDGVLTANDGPVKVTLKPKG